MGLYDGDVGKFDSNAGGTVRGLVGALQNSGIQEHMARTIEDGLHLLFGLPTPGQQAAIDEQKRQEARQKYGEALGNLHAAYDKLVVELSEARNQRNNAYALGQSYAVTLKAVADHYNAMLDKHPEIVEMGYTKVTDEALIQYIDRVRAKITEFRPYHYRDKWYPELAVGDIFIKGKWTEQDHAKYNTYNDATFRDLAEGGQIAFWMSSMEMHKQLEEAGVPKDGPMATTKKPYWES